MIRPLALVALVPLAACAGLPGDRALDAAEVRDLLAGNTMVAATHLKRFEGKVFHVLLRRDGTLVIRSFTGKTDTGRWEVTPEGSYCNQYENTRMGMRRCYQVRQRADDYLLVEPDKDGFVSSSFAVEPGDAMGLGGG